MHKTAADSCAGQLFCFEQIAKLQKISVIRQQLADAVGEIRAHIKIRVKSLIRLRDQLVMQLGGKHIREDGKRPVKFA